MRMLMNKKLRLIGSSFLVIGLIVLFCGPVHAQLTLEKAEEALERVTEVLTPAEIAEEEAALKGRWSINLRTSYGYETNSKLVPLRKGDHFENVRFTLNYRKTMAKRNQFAMTTDISHTNYNEITDLTNTLGHVKFEYKAAFSKQYILGVGYDVSFSFYSLNEDSSYYFHKTFVNVQHRVTKNFYHQLQYNYGWKLFENARALRHSPTTFQDNKRKDIRETVDYTIGYTMNERLSTILRISSYFNNSNAYFQDFHDFHNREVSPRINYKITDQISANASYTYTLKEYSSRNVNSGTYKQRDRITKGKIGFRYRLNNSHSFTFDYTYRQNKSNDLTAHYTGSTIESGWRYIF